MTSLLFLVSIIVIIGALCGIGALLQLNQIKAELAALKKQLNGKTPSTSEIKQDPESVAIAPVVAAPSMGQPVVAAALNPLNPLAVMPQARPAPLTEKHTASPSDDFFSSVSGWIEQQLIKRGMVWLGALALALGGIFLVKHSLDAGWLSPSLRIASGMAFGLALIIGSEWLHKRSQGHALNNYAPAALSSGGFISLYAAVLVALDWYQLISPAVAFPFLAIIALAASWLSLRQGPLLAFIGIVGAYVVPVLVSTDSGNVPALLAYISLVTASSVLVEQKVKRPWLWWLPMSAHLLWLFAAIWIATSDQLWAFWLVLCGSFVLLVWLPRIGFKAQHLELSPQPMRQWWPFSRELILALALLLLACCALLHTADLISFSGMLLFILLLQCCAATDSKSELLLWLSFIPALCWLLLEPLTLSADPYVLSSTSLNQHLLLVAVFTVPMVSVALKWPERLQWSSVLAALPVLLLGLSHGQAKPEVQQQIQLFWTVLALVLVAAQSAMALKTSHKAAAFIQMAGANFALTLCFTLWLADAALTLAIAAQLVLLTLLGIKLRMPVPHWLMKLIGAAVLIRLTTAPLMGRYENEFLLGLHWSFVVYPVALFCFALSWYLWFSTTLRSYLEGALLHLVAVFITVQTQFWLNDAVVDFTDMNFKTLSIQAFNWLLLAWVYQWRSSRAGSTASLYRIAASTLVVLVALAHLQLSLAQNPFWHAAPLGSFPLLNLLLLIWGLPALIFWAFSRLPLSARLTTSALYTAVGTATLYLTGSIRHFWQDGQLLLSLPTSVAEQYSYSLVFLVIAITTVLLAQWQNKARARKAGFVLLSVVVLKVFVVDLNDLTGVLRALSFIGLGLSLVLLGWLFQRLQRAETTT
ncbi:Putative membrane protein [Rheinheimera sp. A13L]|uniref:DUF2339 domain-containing protein n=1 Tax=Rheinheimera sp. A13L TaxID=506534 RepID=UPI0002125341|nr:DUF2339 domain-containing protein [Rheinheimera sp. A13L]EGM77435.1 Putative membrane protein [Rheinheimera sp. A13L]